MTSTLSPAAKRLYDMPRKRPNTIEPTASRFRQVQGPEQRRWAALRSTSEMATVITMQALFSPARRGRDRSR